ncbi:MAG: acyl-CoA dehydrogenase family protein [Saprospiraceae bacterium]|nr:acyl-CoA dehydrogenase family protein [Saprospiraceae bacterium]
MLSLFSTDRLSALTEKVRQFLEEEIYPIEKKLLQLPGKEAEILLNEKRKTAKKTGAWNLYLRPEQGGPGLSLPEIAQLGELLGTTPYGHYLFNCQAPDAGNIELLQEYTSGSLRAQFLQPLIEGNIRSCFAMTEPEYAGSNPILMATTAIRDGEDYLINGHKWFTTGADGAAFAIVMCLTDPEHPNPYERASMILVPTNTPGFRIIRNIPVMGHAGEGWASHSEIKLEQVRVPATNILGQPGQGFRLAQERLGPGRIHHCMRWIGIAERCFDMMCRRAVSREIASGQVLGHKQMVQQWIAESRAEIDSARYMVLHTAHEMETHGQKQAREAISAIKFLASGMLQRVVDRSLQTHGALGMTDDCLVSFYYREERAARIYDGSDETHKAALAKRILRQYGLK